jgi:signal recognition particle GTPase
VGGRINPIIPVNAAYARSTLLVHLPWKKNFAFKDLSDKLLVAKFYHHLENKDFPSSVTIPFYREVQKISDDTKFCEPTSNFDNNNDYHKHTTENDTDLADLIDLAGSLPCNMKENEMHYGFEYDTGLHHDWSEQEYKCDMPADEIETWLEQQLETYNKNDTTIGVGEPTKSDGEKYYIDDCHVDQQEAIARVLIKIKEWIDHVEASNEEEFEPLRLTICGVAGSGKSVLISTLASMIRRIFQNKDSVVICAPTGSAAYNAGGITCH